MNVLIFRGLALLACVEGRAKVAPDVDEECILPDECKSSCCIKGKCAGWTEDCTVYYQECSKNAQGSTSGYRKCWVDLHMDMFQGLVDSPDDIVVRSDDGTVDGDMTNGKLVVNIGRGKVEGGFDPGEAEVPG